ncbi:PP2C family serine/threonine-protein phosphatase [uncultured Oscillibacter sp.]|uniref:PP2C family protein-serine/threonine phosphatase n=1 Tax=uncultured Oscillibacter sp. TaxID=876091 RepID=UPI00262D1C03|nr:PP2C family serine/threonine-protein phosphatase [uncultured Oscillibacter sp.]
MSVFDRLFGRARRVTEDNATVELPRPQGPALRVGNVQGVGARERQEDSFAVCNVSDPEALERAGLFAVVADGMGGMDSGNEASEAAVEAMVQLFRSLLEEGDIPRQLREGALAVSNGIFQRFQGRSGTTVVAVRVLGDTLHWLSVGDSAIFLKRGECVFQLNREHTCLNDLYLRELHQEPIQRERAEQDEDARRLTAFVGMDRLNQVDQSLRPWRLQPGDVVLLCSDGISGVLTVPELKEAMSAPPDEGCRLLETMVAEKNLPAQDNYTGVMIAYQLKQTGER